MWYEWIGSDLKLHIVVQPGASRDGVVGVLGTNLKLRVTSPPTQNQANQHIIKLLAKIFKVPKSRIHIISGGSSKYKTLMIISPTCLLDGMVPH